MMASSAFLSRAIWRQSLTNLSEGSPLVPFTDKAFASEYIDKPHLVQDTVWIARWQPWCESPARQRRRHAPATRAGATAFAWQHPSAGQWQVSARNPAGVWSRRYRALPRAPPPATN